MLIRVLALALTAATANAGELSLAFRNAEFGCDGSYQLQQVVLIQGADTDRLAQARTLEQHCEDRRLLRSDIEQMLSQQLGANQNYRWRGHHSTLLFSVKDADSTAFATAAREAFSAALANQFPRAEISVKAVGEEQCLLPQGVDAASSEWVVPTIKLGVSRYPVSFASAAAGKPHQCSLWFEAAVMIDGVVAAHVLKPGDRLETSDLRVVSLDQLRYPQQFSSINALVGKTITAYRKEGEPVTGHDTRLEQDVVDGQRVSYQMRRGMVEISGQAVALTGGRVGEVIRIALAETDSTIRARITGQGEVLIDASL